MPSPTTTPAHPPIRVMLVEDDAATREGFMAEINRSAQLRLIGAAATLDSARYQLSENPLDVLLLDLDLAGQDGAELIAPAKSADIRIVVISAMGDESQVMRAIQLGADGYLLKTADQLHIESLILDVMAGKPPLSAEVARYMLRALHETTGAKPESSLALSPRETQMLQLIATGYSHNEIADQLGLSYYTVVDYVRSLYRKMEVNSRSEALMVGVRQGLIS